MNESNTLPRRFRPLGWSSQYVVSAVALIAALAAGYLVYLSVAPGAEPLGCDAETGGGCSTVLDTQWSTVFGVPVSIGALTVYTLIALTLLGSGRMMSKLGWSVLMLCTTLGVGAGMWFIGLLLFELEATCYYCLTVHSCGIILCLWVWLRAPLGSSAPAEAGPQTVVVSPGRAMSMVLLGLVGLVVLIGGQVYEIAGGDVSGGDVAVENGGQGDGTETFTIAQPPYPQKQISLADGKILMKLGGYPIIGSPDAEQYIAIMFDYTCPGCRRLHRYLREAMQLSNNAFALICMPMPLDAQCNRRMDRTRYEHRNACFYAKTALAVWLAKPEHFDEFDAWIFENEKFRPSKMVTKARAEELLGKEIFEQAYKHQAVNVMLNNDFTIFYGPNVNKKSVPVLITEKTIRVGGMNREKLQAFIKDYLGIEYELPPSDEEDEQDHEHEDHDQAADEHP